MRIIVTADMVPTKTNEQLFLSGDTHSLIGTELENLFFSADFRVVNLEMPLYDGESPIGKAGPCLRANTECVNLYRALHVDLVTLGNNHIMDQDEAGYRSTIEQLKKNKISHVGAGESYAEAKRPFILELEGKRIGFYSCAEHEFSIVSDIKKKSGANPYLLRESSADVMELQKQCDFVVVLYHGGKEHYRYPSPELQKNCRYLVEAGADLVLCQHSHCIGCEEEYLGKTILYGQGNFIFDEEVDECWDSGLIVQITDDFKIDYIPVERTNNTVRLAQGETKKIILEKFKQRSDRIKEPGAVAQEYEKLAKENIRYYLFVLSGVSRKFWFRAINKLSGHRFGTYYIRKKYTPKQLRAIQNAIECEAHHELLLAGLKLLIDHTESNTESCL